MTKTYTDIMLDLETMSTAPNAAICSIGAVAFNLSDVTSLDALRANHPGFDVCVNLRGQDALGRVIDADTVYWWLDRSDAARDALNRAPVHLSVAIDSFCEWSRATGATRLWGNGAAADNVWLRTAVKSLGRDKYLPFNFRQDRCYRTIREEFGAGVGMHAAEWMVPHNAFHDAIYQAGYLQRIWAGISKPQATNTSNLEANLKRVNDENAMLRAKLNEITGVADSAFKALAN